MITTMRQYLLLPILIFAACASTPGGAQTFTLPHDHSSQGKGGATISPTAVNTATVNDAATDETTMNGGYAFTEGSTTVDIDPGETHALNITEGTRFIRVDPSSDGDTLRVGNTGTQVIIRADGILDASANILTNNINNEATDEVNIDGGFNFAEGSNSVDIDPGNTRPLVISDSTDTVELGNAQVIVNSAANGAITLDDGDVDTQSITLNDGANQVRSFSASTGTSKVVTNSTSFTDWADMTISLAAGVHCTFQVSFAHTVSTDSGQNGKVTFAYSGVAGAARFMSHAEEIGTGTFVSDTLPLGGAATFESNTGNKFVFLTLHVETGNAGTLSLQVAQNAANANSTTFNDAIMVGWCHGSF